MNVSFNVVLWKIRERPGRRKPHQVRWSVDGKEHNESFRAAAAAQSFRAELNQALSKGEGFDLESGLPASKVRERTERAAREAAAYSWFRHANDYVDYTWPRVSGNQRRSVAESLMAATLALLPTESAPDSAVLRAALRGWAFTRRQHCDDQPAEIKAALDWVEQSSPPALALADLKTLRTVLDAFTRNLDGSRSKASYFSRRRRVFYNVLKYAVMEDRLESNPLDNPKLNWKPPTDQRVSQAVDTRSIGSKQQVTNVLTAVGYVGTGQGPRFEAFFATMYYGMCRPEEVAGLHEEDTELPEKGWGLLRPGRTRPTVGKAWTDTGGTHEQRGLKQRAETATRTVPIPPDLVRLLRKHIDTYGVGPDGLIFRSVNGNPIAASTYNLVWSKARKLGLSPKDQRSMVLKRPYDLRHAGVTARLYAGVPDRQVAEWAGHSVDVLRRIYSQILAGFDNTWHSKMDQFFGDGG